MAITTVLFDAGNTLVELDWERVSGIFRAAGEPRTPALIREAAIRLRPDLDAWLENGSRSTETRDTYRHLLGLLFDRLEVTEPSVQARIAAAIAAAMSGLWTVPTEGAGETLEALAAAGFRLGVISNSNGQIERILEDLGFASRFATIVDSEIEGVEKPDPRIFRIALDRIGSEPSESVYIGDLPSIDLGGARAAGLRGILLDPLDVFAGTEWTRIRTLNEIPSLLGQL